MASIDFSKLPKFSDLPVRPGAPRDSAWGVFGDDDEVGCVNLLTQEGIVAAARLVKNGKAFRLDMPIGYGSPPLFGRGAPRHSIIRFSGSLGHDDQLDHFNTQEGSQWDGLGHAGDDESNAFYNGFKRDQIKRGPEGKLGIHHWANRLVGRGVLIDAFKYRADQGRPIDPGDTDIYTIDDLENAAEAQGPSDEQLESISALIRRQVEAEQAVESSENSLKRAKQNLKSIREERLPEAMRSAGVIDFTTPDFLSATLNDVYYANIKEEDRDDAFAWLKEEGHDDIIKNDVNLSFGRGEEEEANNTYATLVQMGLNPTTKKHIHWQTLRAFVKEQMTKGVTLPDSISVIIVPTTKIKRK
ncbi:MAG: cyclase family protein [Chloroflexi bacterium]|nr:cyclase family protein [Chloroflexota bacterium]